MKFTGERFIPTEQGRIRLEHYHRYAIVLDAVKGKDVLDVACGEGYGSSLMADTARSVVGVDISNEAVRHASGTYAKSNLTFRQGSATNLNIADQTFDVVVSFETIEHLAEQAQMLAELRRVLRPEGVLVISSPNRPIYSEESGEHNEFHIKELDFKEFDELLKSRFQYIEYFGQRMLMGSVIQALQGKHGAYHAWHDDGISLNPNTGKLIDPVYFVAVCSAKKDALPILEASVLYPDKLDLVKHYVGFAKWAQTLDRTLAERDSQLTSLRQAVGERDGQLTSLSQAVAERDGQLSSLSQAVAKLSDEMDRRGEWASGLDSELKASQAQHAKLNQLLVERENKVESLVGELEIKQLNIEKMRIELQKYGQSFYLLKALFKNIAGHGYITYRVLTGQIALKIRVKRILAEQGDFLLCSKMFNSEWYLKTNQDVAQAGMNPLQHYLRRGAAEGRNPNPLFDSRWYLETNPDVAAVGMNPLIHYINKGATEGRKPNALFDSRWYLDSYPDVAAAGMNPLAHYLNHGAAEGRNPNSIFDGRWYLQTNPDVMASGMHPLAHYLSKGAAEGRKPSPVFDGRWYLETYPDVAAAGMNPLAHYLNHGAEEGRNPSPIFDSCWYLEQHPDVSAAGLNPVVHFLHFGAAEGRQPKPQPFRDIKVLREHLLRQNRKPVEQIRFEWFDAPKVSVIIPIYNKIEYTLQCLESICRFPPLTDFEIIVVDDCSSDDSAKILGAIEGVKVISNKANQGFIRSCNSGAKSARGKYLHFLNNDTEVTDGWLDELCRTFHEFPGTGLAGSKLVYPDGSLQEAGGIIWQDGSAWNFGRAQDPQLPVYNYAREVDYCSGASIMIPKVLFEDMGGFDEHYLPAYCEDSDLALKIRNQGYRVIYQPMSTIIHYEGITSGTDTSQGAKAYQIENGKKLFARWKDLLQTHQTPGIDVDNAKDRCVKHRVLVLEHSTPTPNQDAGSVSVFNIVLLLREMGFQVTFIPEDNFAYVPEYTSMLQRSGIETLFAPYCTSVEEHLKEYGNRYDLVFLFRPLVVERNISVVRKYCANAKTLYYTHDLHYLRMTREAELVGDEDKLKAAEEMKLREYDAMSKVDGSIVVSNNELEILHKELPDEEIHLLPLILDIPGTKSGYSERRDIIFVGGYSHSPNVDAVKYFVSEIWPLVRIRLPEVYFLVVGSNPPPEILALASDDVIIKGFVDDLSSLLDKVRVSVAPLRYGAGIKGKIGTSMAAGLPVVATMLAAEGMALTEGENILIADGDEQFADALARLYHNEILWAKISRNGIAFAEQAWGAEAARNILSGILATLSIETVRSNHPLSLFGGNVLQPKRDEQNVHDLIPIATFQNRAEFDLFLDSPALEQIKAFEKKFLDLVNDDDFAVDGYCIPCNQNVSFLVDMRWGGQRNENGWLPNWRERLECPMCKMNNRQRLIATLIKQELNANNSKNIYFMEQVTPIYSWVTSTFKNHLIVGSEYLGHEYDGGEIVNGIRHEDVEMLSFPADSLDLIVSNDVFEHVPNPAKAFAECARALKNTGVMLASIPFHSGSDKSVVRAKIVNGQLENIMQPSYHGNPVSPEGSIVFTDFGWEVLSEMRNAGFSSVCVEVYASAENGHLGGGQLIFRLRK